MHSEERLDDALVDTRCARALCGFEMHFAQGSSPRPCLIITTGKSWR